VVSHTSSTRSFFSNAGTVRISSGRLPGYADVSRNQLSSRVHTALKHFLGVIPAAGSALSGILTAKFPFADESKNAHMIYTNNLMSILRYAPHLKSDIFALITDRLVKIDVQMQVDLDDLDDEVAAAIVHAISLNPSSQNDDGEGEDDSDVDSVTSDDALDAESKRIKEIQSNVEKMDAILDLLFTTYSPYFLDPHSREATEMFETLLAHFQKIILPTYRSRHTQFLLFHFSQTADYLVDQFAGTCAQLAFDSSCPAVLRQSSAAYLASFVARGVHVQPHVVRTVFELIGSKLDDIRAENELTCRGPNLRRYSTFYAMTQALLYIFCFRWRDLLIASDEFDDDDSSGQDLHWIPGIKETLFRTIHSKLNPLKICSPPIVAEFAKIAKHLEFMQVYPLLETNKRIRLSQYSSGQSSGAIRDSGLGTSDESWHQLDAYFPFDPYQLPISKKWIEDDYVQWKGIPGLNQEDDDSDDEDEAEENVDADLDSEDTATDNDDE
jgi:RNA polymerase I-specific transcription initiation factor RRN3